MKMSDLCSEFTLCYSDTNVETPGKTPTSLTPTRRGTLGEVKFFLDTGRTDVNSRRVFGGTPVMAVARWGHRDVVELLVGRGADVSLVDDDGSNIFH
ncbi:ankyrin repeat domain-containing protein 29-like [Haliotis rubra]|uniref:ankyrin repeat domain-containing protein 29-like n=1 Tax=Haliotis rubra TaxID=36100 RepID=UPI001EE5DB1C|nr:ankyrin repeat domain-containing protein 29-like [Haliotis rubra]